VRRVADGARLTVRCGPLNPTPYAEWPDPSVTDALLHLRGRSRLTSGAGSGAPVTFTDNARADETELAARNRLLYVTDPLPRNLRISGSPRVSLRVAFSKPKANLSVALVSLPENSRAATFLTRGWIDPENRASDTASEPVAPGTFYTLTFPMQAKDTIVARGRRLGLMVFSSDRQYTIRPAPGTRVTLDPTAGTLTLPVVGPLATP
jgi:predicted acyl esterase